MKKNYKSFYIHIFYIMISTYLLSFHFQHIELLLFYITFILRVFDLQFAKIEIIGVETI